MALTKSQKSEQVTELRDMLKRAKSFVWMEYRGLSVGDISDLRNRIRKSDSMMKVAKKTLFRIATKDESFPEMSEETMEGPVAFVFSFEDSVSGAKAAFEFGKDHEQVKLLGGVLDGKVLSQQEVIDLAKMLSREELLAKFVGMIQSPPVSFSSICSSPLRSFAIGLKDLAEKGGVRNY